MTTVIGCPGRFSDKLDETGEGFGATKSAALDAARAEARTKLDLQVANRVCAGGCNRTVSADPDFDGGEPAYEPWPDSDSPGFKCKLTQSRRVRIDCTTQTSSLFDVPLMLPLPDGAVADHRPALYIAYVSARQRTVFVAQGRAGDAIAALGATQLADGWQLPGSSDVYALKEVGGDASAGCGCDGAAALPMPDEPLPGDRRVKEDHTCGPVTPGWSSDCRPIGDSGYYLRSDRTPIAYCRRAEGRCCVEFYRRISTVGLYKGEGCRTLVDESTLYGWVCLGLF